MSGTVLIQRFLADAHGCVAYLIQDPGTSQALVLDPRLDQVEEIRAAAARSGARIAWVLDSHLHADHLSGVAQLAQLAGARVAVHESSHSRVAAERVTDGAELVLGGTSVRILHTPGHTPDSISLFVGGHLFTGDALLVGGAGRTDFMGGSTDALFETYRKFKALPVDTVVHPGHDYVGRAETSLAAESASNPAYQQVDAAGLRRLIGASKPPPANLDTILAFNAEQPLGATISAAELGGLMRGPLTPRLLDVRTPIEYAGEHIAGSVLIPLDQLEARLAEIPADVPHIVICRSGMRATTAAQRLARSGRTARVLTGGMQAWRKAGLPIVEAPAPLPLDRQVQIVVGTSVLASVLLGTLVHPAFLAVAAFFGAGLTFAGVTGTCGLALVLARLPWNQVPAPAAPAGATCAAPAATCAAGSAPESTCAAAPRAH